MKAPEHSLFIRERSGMFDPSDARLPALWRLVLLGACLTLFSALFTIGAITVIGWVI